MTFEAIQNGHLIPAVDPLHLQTFWETQSQQAPTASISERAIRQLFGGSEEINPIAIWARALLITLCDSKNGLAPWRKGTSFTEVVFQKAAVFPLPNGVQGATTGLLLAALI